MRASRVHVSLVLLACCEKLVCEEVAQKWRPFMQRFETVFNMGSNGASDREARLRALSNLALPRTLTIEHFGKLRVEIFVSYFIIIVPINGFFVDLSDLFQDPNLFVLMFIAP